MINLSRSAARKLDMIEDGTAPVKVEVKPSEQPTDTAREKVEEKVDQLTPGNQVAQGDGNRNSGTSGGSRSDTVSHSGSGK
ncbi:septal ring lytic transglycosylase RlpA family protein [Azospirillum sp. B506]|uniref:septal ring lytic transglycosylase RlpA family protein n=1 Tax=Azospirillum sp. B506 TaxID=137721 RepID=UPI000348A758|nr:septal ring lytic transglycosylase RlpA family protein [Azospirillum sp. B506]